MSDYEKDNEIRYLKGVIKSLMDYKGVDDLERIRDKHICGYCYRKMEPIDPQANLWAQFFYGIGCGTFVLLGLVLLIFLAMVVNF